jgi:hypothetical protein
MEIKDMNKGVQILLERMDSNPEEFYTDNKKWLDIISVVVTRIKHICREDVGVGLTSVSTDIRLSLCPLKDEEVITLHTKLKAISSDEFTHTVMARLLTDDSSYSLGSQLKTAISAARIKGAP